MDEHENNTGIEEPTRDVWFNPYRLPRTERARTVVRDVWGQVQTAERMEKRRKRARRPADLERFTATITAIVADLIHFHLSGHPGGLIVSRSNQVLGSRSRYRPAIYSKTFPRILDLLAMPVMNFVEQSIGEPVNLELGRRLSTTIRPGRRLITRIAEHHLTFDDLTESSDGETIILKDTPDGLWDEAHVVEYKDTKETIQYREQMKSINEWLGQADIAFKLVGFDQTIDVAERRLRRIFTRSSFKSGGRLYGVIRHAILTP